MQGLFALIQAYASLAPLSNLKWPDELGSEKIQQALIKHLILSRHFKTYPPSDAYQWSFWKWIIQQIEEHNEEVEEVIYDYFLSFMSSSSSKPGMIVQSIQPSYVTYIRQSDEDCPDIDDCQLLDRLNKCTLLEARTTIESGTTGLRTWAAGLVLAEYLEQHKDLLANSRILELGSGAGFLGIVSAQMQLDALETQPSNSQAALCLTDANEEVLNRCRHNVGLDCNKLKTHPSLAIKYLDWTDSLDDNRKSHVSSLLQEVNADLILGTDLVYDVDIIPALVAILKLALSLQGDTRSKRKALLAVTPRNEGTIGQFLEQARVGGLDVLEEAVVRQPASAIGIGNQPDAAGREAVTIKIFWLTIK